MFRNHTYPNPTRILILVFKLFILTNLWSQTNLEYVSHLPTEDFRFIESIGDKIIVAGGNYLCNSGSVYCFGDSTLEWEESIKVKNYNFCTGILKIDNSSFFVYGKDWQSDDVIFDGFDFIYKYDLDGNLLDSITMPLNQNGSSHSSMIIFQDSLFLFGSGNSIFTLDKNLDIVNHRLLSANLTISQFAKTHNEIYFISSNKLYKLSDPNFIVSFRYELSNVKYSQEDSLLILTSFDSIFTISSKTDLFVSKKILSAPINDFLLHGDSIIVFGQKNSDSLDLSILDKSLVLKNNFTEHYKLAYTSGVLHKNNFVVIGNDYGLVFRPFVKQLSNLRLIPNTKHNYKIELTKLVQEITDSLKTPSGTLYKTNAYLNYRITNLTSINTNEVQVISSVYGGFNCLTAFEQDQFTSVNGGSISTGEFSIKNAGYFLSELKVCVEVFSPDHYFDIDHTDNIACGLISDIKQIDQSKAIYYDFTHQEFQLSDHFLHSEFMLYNLQGQLVNKGVIFANHLSTRNLPTGLYILSLPKQGMTYRFVVR